MRLAIKNIRKGDKFWERARQFVASEDARTETIEMGGKIVNQYFVWGEPVDQSPVTAPRQVQFLETEGAEHYGPKLEADMEDKEGYLARFVMPRMTVKELREMYRQMENIG
jgi:hypothetical protein